MEKILIVDDDPEVPGVLKNFLERQGYRVDIASSAEEAGEKLASRDYALLITDIRMGGKSGLDLAREAKKKLPFLEIIVISAIKDITMAIEAMKAGAFSYLLKPFYLEEVLSNVRNALERRRLRIQNLEYRQHLEMLVEERTRKLKYTLQALRNSYLEILKVLVATLDARDVETEGHSERVVELSLEIASKMGINDRDFLRNLRLGALLHDIGKIGVPDRILKKEGKLTPSEWAIMKEHVLIGYKIVSNVDFLRGASEIVLYHHERWDGKGYPHGLKGEEIPLGARIFAVADAFDAMISRRVYRKALPLEEARKEIEKNKGTQFDPRVVEAFLSIPVEQLREFGKKTSARSIWEIPEFILDMA